MKPISDVRQGEPITARGENEVRQALRMAVNPVRTDGTEGVHNGAFSAKGHREALILMVRIVAFTVPEGAAAYASSNLFNAKVQVWDGTIKDWADDPSGREVSVVPLFNGVGYQPLEIDRKPIPVRYRTDLQAYAPIAWSEVAVVVPTSEEIDSQGMQPGKRLAYNSDASDWVIVSDVYILRIGN
jgi:hypothetical protein